MCYRTATASVARRRPSFTMCKVNVTCAALCRLSRQNRVVNRSQGRPMRGKCVKSRADLPENPKNLLSPSLVRWSSRRLRSLTTVTVEGRAPRYLQTRGADTRTGPSARAALKMGAKWPPSYLKPAIFF